MASPPQSDLKPARFITPAIRQRLQERLTEARKLSRAEPCPHGRIDKLLCECVIVDPGNTVYIGALLHHLRRSDRPRRTEFIPFWKRFFGEERNEFRSTLSQAAAASDWNKVLTLGPPALCRQPDSVEILRHLAAACTALEHEQAELCYLQAAMAISRDDADTQRQLARALTRQGLFDDAAAAWKHLAEMLPEDEECRKTIKILCEHEPPADLKAGLLEAQLAMESGNGVPEQIEKLLQQLRTLQRFDEAQRLLARAAAIHGSSLALLQWQEDLALDMSRWRSLTAWKLAQWNPEYESCAQRLSEEHDRVELQVYRHRSERHPGDPSIQFRLGQLLLRNRNYSEAVKRLEPAKHIDAFRDEATCDLAEAWYGLRQSDKVEACLEDALAADSALGIKVLDRLKECAVSVQDFDAARRYLDRRWQFEAARTRPTTS